MLLTFSMKSCLLFLLRLNVNSVSSLETSNPLNSFYSAFKPVLHAIMILVVLISNLKTLSFNSATDTSIKSRHYFSPLMFNWYQSDVAGSDLASFILNVMKKLFGCSTRRPFCRKFCNFVLHFCDFVTLSMALALGQSFWKFCQELPRSSARLLV